MRKVLIVGQLLIIAALGSCTKEESTGDVYKGSITGKVYLVDEFGNSVPDFSLMSIGTNNDKYGTTSSAGTYLIYGLPDGSYDLTYSRDGFGVFKKFGIPVSGQGNTDVSGTDTIGKTSKTVINNLLVTADPGDSSFSFTCAVAPVPSVNTPRGIRLFFSSRPDVYYQEYDFTPSYKWIATTATGSINAFSINNFLNNGFAHGDTIYVVGYGDAVYSNTYTDPLTGKKRFPNLNVSHQSNTAQFVLR